MDGEKGVMLSQRPAAAPGVSIGNYKGVMLCNRPLAAGGAGGGGGGGGGGGAGNSGPKPAFKAGLPKERVNPRGYDPEVLDRKANAPSRSKPVTALGKHKAWLRDLQRQRDEMKEAMLLQELEAEDRRAKFAENQKAIRDAIRGVLDDATEAAKEKGNLMTLLSPRNGGDAAAAAVAAAAAAPAPAASPTSVEVPALSAAAVQAAARASAAAEAQDTPASLRDGALSQAQAKKLGTKHKPAWAMTKVAAQEAAETEADELLDFVAGLDFENFVDDIEVRAALEAARERIEALATERDSKEADDDDGGGDAGRDGYDAESKEAGGGGGGGGGGLSEDSLRRHDARSGSHGRKADDTASLADTVMSNASTISQVHSKRSLQKVIDRTKARLEAHALSAIPEAGAPPELPPVPAPRIVVSDDAAKAMEAKKGLVSTLPFQHRNPSV